MLPLVEWLPQMQSFIELLEAIKRPFIFLSKSSFVKISSVKELDKRTISLARKALEETPEIQKQDLLKNLIKNFEVYENADMEEKIGIIKNSISILDILEGKKQTPERKFQCFSDNKHPIFQKSDFLNHEERLSESVQYLKGVGPKIAEKFAKAGIFTVGDILYFFPWRYEDRRKMLKIAELKEDTQSTFIAEIKDIHVVYFRGMHGAVLELKIGDDTGEIIAKWFHFNRSYFEDKIKIGQMVIFTGKLKNFRGKREIHHPEFEALGKGLTDSLSFGRVVPIYTEIGGLYQKTLRKIMYGAILGHAKDKICFIPRDICMRYDLFSPEEALLEIHFPDKHAERLLESAEHFIKSPAYRTLIFSELFIFNLLIGLKKRTLKIKTGLPMKITDSMLEDYFAKLPFKLTASQITVVNEIRNDLSMQVPMNRLLEGDVGSGKTVVALLSSLLAIKNGYQAAFMAPTEILAEQIYNEAQKLFSKYNLKVELMIGGQDEKTRKRILKGLSDGSINMSVGTHALIQEDVKFKNLGLIVVDEQHRFGVVQRGAIREKGEFPHVLVMSATPIPRTLALTYYGDLDISTIRELPKGRKPITTRIVNDQARLKLYDFVKSELTAGRQAYIIYPIIEESKKVNLHDATGMAKYLSANIFPSYKVELIHGRIPSDKKDKIMTNFRSGKIDILVSTTVIEVGIDVPNATVMIIEHPERFGLSQLHQLRGRVGRGAFKSYCFLLLGVDYGEEIKERLTIFKNTQDGFKLAEEDLRLRGPGDFFGVSQSGLPPFKIAQFPRDLELLKITRNEAFELLQKDYHLQEKENSLLPIVIKSHWKDKAELIQIG